MTFNKILFFLALLLLGNCQNTTLEEVNFDKINLLPNKGIFVYQDIPFTGIAVEFYPNSKQLERRVTFKKGKKDGSHELFFADGKLGQTTFYQDGKRYGESKTWWNNGNLRTFSNFENDKSQGIHEEFYKEGMIFKRLNLKDGREKGLQQAWRKNGDIYVNYEAKNGRNFGLKRAGLCYELKAEEIVKD
jgi:antitoxin component YwqK of YwqJK toxin-antitoxin module